MVPGDLLAEPGDRAVVTAKKSSQAQEQRRLSGPGPADQPDYFAAIDIEIYFA
jgi:hypothetical protein